MKKNYGSLLLRNLTGFGLVVMMLLTSSTVSLATTGSALSGEIIVSGQSVDGVAPTVTLDGENVVSGRSFFNSAVIATPENGSATINLGGLGSISMAPSTTLSLALAANTISGDITSGSVQVFNAEGVQVTLRGNSDVVTNDASVAGSMSVDMTSGTAVASSTEGTVYVNGVPAAAQMSQRKRAYIIAGVVGGAIATALIIYAVTRDDEQITSPAR